MSHRWSSVLLALALAACSDATSAPDGSRSDSSVVDSAQVDILGHDAQVDIQGHDAPVDVQGHDAQPADTQPVDLQPIDAAPADTGPIPPGPDLLRCECSNDVDRDFCVDFGDNWSCATAFSDEVIETFCSAACEAVGQFYVTAFSCGFDAC